MVFKGSIKWWGSDLWGYGVKWTEDDDDDVGENGIKREWRFYEDFWVYMLEERGKIMGMIIDENEKNQECVKKNKMNQIEIRQ